MKRFVKWTGLVAAGLVAVLLVGLAYAYFASERELHRTFTAMDASQLVVPADAVGIAAGRRIAKLGGCMHCHGETLNGGLVDDIPHLVRLVAPNISVVIPRYTDAQLATVLRKGVKPDGHSVLFMPSEMFRHLGDEDLGRLIAYLRTVPATSEGVREKTQLRVIARVLLAKGDFKTSALAIQTLPPASNVFDPDDPVSHGRYLTMSYCSECHGQSLEGFAPINAPPLSVVKGYSDAAFAKLLREGIAPGDRALKLMGPTSKARFSSFSPEEIAAIYAFLHSRS
jgi:mono/diheme cytochrome c family protein